MASHILKPELYDLPFDQFSRQYYVAQYINAIKRVMGIPKATILDLGGYKGKTAEFQYEDDVIVADLFDVNQKNYIKIEPGKLPFKDKEFDITVSFDTFEHVPRDAREQFIKEALRVSKGFHVLAAPFDNENGDVNAAELRANDVYRAMSGKDHHWLLEHLEYGIPRNGELETICDKIGIRYVTKRTNELTTWLTLQQVFFTAEILTKPFPYVLPINRFYNHNLKKIEANIADSVAYRTIYCLSDNIQLINQLMNEEKDVLSDEATISNAAVQLKLELLNLVHNAYLSLAE